MTTNNLLLVVLVGLVAFAAIPQWIALLIGIVIGTILRLNVPSMKGFKSWIYSITTVK